MGLCRVIKLRAFRWEEHAGLSRRAQCNCMNTYRWSPFPACGQREMWLRKNDQGWHTTDSKDGERGSSQGMLVASRNWKRKEVDSPLESCTVFVVSWTRAENQMETCGVHLDGTLFLPVQGRTPRVPVKAAKGSSAKRLQASSFMRAKQASKLQKRELWLSLHSSGVRRNFCSGVRRNYLSVSCW